MFFLNLRRRITIQKQTAVKQTPAFLSPGVTGVQAIDELDLDPIKVKLMSEEGEGWSVQQVNTVEKWYKRFLALCLWHLSKPIVPTKAIDTFWHYHILDTMKYAEDCQNVFGYFLHHFPYFGMRGDEDDQARVVAFRESERLFFEMFSEPYSNSGTENGSLCFDGQGGCQGGEHISNLARPTLASSTVN